MWDAVNGSRGDRDLAIHEEFNDVEGGADLSHPTTNQLVETVIQDGVSVTPVINGHQTDMDVASIQAVAAPPREVPSRAFAATGPRRHRPSGDGTFVATRP